MTVRCRTYVTDSTGATEYTHLSWQAAVPGAATSALSVRIYNQETATNATDVKLWVVRGDLRDDDPAGEGSETTAEMARELIDESWLEAKVGAGAWTPLNKSSGAGFSVGAIAAGAYVAVDIRLNIPAGAASRGELNWALAIRATTA